MVSDPSSKNDFATRSAGRTPVQGLTECMWRDWMVIWDSHERETAPCLGERDVTDNTVGDGTTLGMVVKELLVVFFLQY